jgi:hypothetical protein
MMKYFEALTCLGNPAAVMIIEPLLNAEGWAWEPVPDVIDEDEDGGLTSNAVYGVIVGFADPGDDDLPSAVQSVIGSWGACLEADFKTKPTTYAERFEQHTGRKYTDQ